MRDTHNTNLASQNRTHDANGEQPSGDGQSWIKILIPTLIAVLASTLTSLVAYKVARSQQRQEIEKTSKEQHAKAYGEYLTEAIKFRREAGLFLAQQKKVPKGDCQVVHEKFHPNPHRHPHHIPVDIPDIDSRFKRLPGYPSYLHALGQVYVYGSTEGLKAAIKMDAGIIPPHQFCTIAIVNDSNRSTPVHRIPLRSKSGTTDRDLKDRVRNLRTIMCKEAPAKPRDNCAAVRAPSFMD